MKSLIESHRKQRENLPIAAVKERLIDVIKFHDIVIIVGETGSGKTTQLPQFLFESGLAREGRVIGVTQPRRVAAVTVAKRVSEEAGVQLGSLVGYSIRFDDKTSPSTRIKYLTDGLLLREALLDPYLTRYSVIIVDEAHERTVHTDVLLGLLKNIISVRQNQSKKAPLSVLKPYGNTKATPLKLIIMSASLDAKVFCDYFNNAKALHIEGRQHPVDILYTVHPQTDYVEAAFVTLLQIHIEEPPGDILVFFTGQEEIESVENLIRHRLPQLPEKNRKISVVPIFSSLPSEQQMRVFSAAPEGCRKVILATNIAETSVTIPNVKYVVDPGFVKARNYDPTKGIESLVVIPTSKAQALQRTGRAGRDGPGKCFRLYPEREFAKLEDSTVPEIKRCNLSNVILQLKALGVDDIMGFDFLEKPSKASIIKSLEQLFLLGALTDECKLSDPLGYQMARLPLDPVYSKALILANQFGCLEEMLITVAMLSVESIFYRPREKSDEVKMAVRSLSSEDGDHLTLVNVFRGAEKSRNEKMRRKWCKENFVNYRSLKHARDVYEQISGHLGQLNMKVVSCEGDEVRFRKCLAASFFQNAALRQSDGSYRALGSGQTVFIHPNSVLFQSKVDCVVFNELVETNRKYIRSVSRIDYLWLAEVAPNMYSINT